MGHKMRARSHLIDSFPVKMLNTFIHVTRSALNVRHSPGGLTNGNVYKTRYYNNIIIITITVVIMIIVENRA